MLLNENNYRPPAIAPTPSVAGFKAWLERQPREITFDYWTPAACAVRQYLDSLRVHWSECRIVAQACNRFAYRAEMIARNRLPTFGDVLAEIEKAGVS